MDKFIAKNIFTLFAVSIVTVGSFVIIIQQVFEEVAGENFSANVGVADLSSIASKWPYLLLIGAILSVILLSVNLLYRTKK